MTRVEGENTRLRHYLARCIAKRCAIPNRLRCLSIPSGCWFIISVWRCAYSRLIHLIIYQRRIFSLVNYAIGMIAPFKIAALEFAL
jgi:hypothetical protein